MCYFEQELNDGLKVAEPTRTINREKPMERRDLTFRVFVSSTFSDLKAERNALQQETFPKLREYCRQRGARFQAIDLRWGVSQEAALDQQTMNICFAELARCQELSPKPNFIVLLGQRYGWRPLPTRIPADVFEKVRDWLTTDGTDNTEAMGLLGDWYRLDENADPSEYVLLPRAPDGQFADHVKWGAIEQLMQEALCRGARAIGLTGRALLPYCAAATHQEIDHGAFGATDAEKHVFAYLRDVTGAKAGTERISEFVDTVGSPDATDLEALRHRIATKLPAPNVLKYAADWGDVLRRNPPETANPSILDLASEPDLKALCDRVFENLKGVIDDELRQFTQATDLEREQEAHREFGKERCAHFKGRTDVLSRLDDYLKDSGDNKPLVIHGTSGCGKTALMAQAILECGVRNAECGMDQEESAILNPKSAIVSRFIGATPGSADLRSLLRSLCEELEVGDIPQDMNELVRKFRERMTGQSEGGKGNADAGEKPAVVFLDALDQLNDTDNALMLYWLPRQLAPEIKLVVSVLEDETKDQGEDKKGWMDRKPYELCQQIWKDSPNSLVQISKMSRHDGEDLLDAWLASVGRRLQDGQKADVLDKFAADGRPLYLKLAFEEARLWHSWDGLPSGAHSISGLGEKVEDILVDMLHRLEQRHNHGRILVDRALGGIATGKNGLTEDELLDVLSRDKDVMDDFKAHNPKSPDIDKLPVVIWSRLHASLKPYMTERRADGTNVMNFYHRQVVEAVRQRYLEPVENRLAAHNRLGDYFGDEKMDWWAESLEAQRARAKRLPPTPRPANIRKVVELPYHLLERAKLVDPESKNPDAVYRGSDGQDVKVWDSVADLLTNWQFLEAKTEADPNFDAEADRKQAAESESVVKEARK